MGNLWLKIKIWTKIILAGLLVIFALLFLFNNHGEPVHIWLFKSINTSVLRLLFFTILFSVAGSFLIATAFRTLRQVRELKDRNRKTKDERDLAEMRAKAAMLQTKAAPQEPKIP
jgi:uncharacterized integral membrane protein